MNGQTLPSIARVKFRMFWGLMVSPRTLVWACCTERQGVEVPCMDRTRLTRVFVYGAWTGLAGFLVTWRCDSPRNGERVVMFNQYFPQMDWSRLLMINIICLCQCRSSTQSRARDQGRESPSHTGNRQALVYPLTNHEPHPNDPNRIWPPHLLFAPVPFLFTPFTVDQRLRLRATLRKRNGRETSKWMYARHD